jgi:hypothetical protein
MKTKHEAPRLSSLDGDDRLVGIVALADIGCAEGASRGIRNRPARSDCKLMVGTYPK